MPDRSSLHKGSPDVAETLALEMQQIVRDAAQPIGAGETIKAQMRRAWERLLGWSKRLAGLALWVAPWLRPTTTEGGDG